jgi:3-oxoadipate enol-lactonase
MVPDFATMWRKLRETVRQNGLESIVEPTVQRWFSEDFKAAHPKVLDKVRAMIRRTTFEGYMGATAAFLGLAEEARLHEIKAPTLYVSGADDKLGGPPALMAGLAAKVPGARHVSVPKAAHIANIQNPEGFNQVLEAFLK